MWQSKLDFKRIYLKRKNKEVFYSIVLILVPILFLIGIASWIKIGNIETENQAATVIESIPEPKKPELILDLSANSAYVERINTGEIIYSKNSDKVLPLASITKVMTALVAYENLSNKDSKINISTEDLLTEGEYNLISGEGFTLPELIDLTLIASANDGASALASASANYQGVSKAYFIDEMNEYAKKINMQNTFFKNETGLDVSLREASAAGSASDVAELFKYVIKNHPDIFEATKKTKLSVVSSFGLIHNLDNTNDIAGELDNLIASKTGYTDLAGGNLAVIVDIGLNDPYVIVVLGSTKEKRFSDVQQIVDQLIISN